MKSPHAISENIQQDLEGMLSRSKMYALTPEALIMGVFHDVSLLAFIWEKEPPSFRRMGLACGFGALGDNRVLFPDEITEELVARLRKWAGAQPPHPLEKLAAVSSKSPLEPSK